MHNEKMPKDAKDPATKGDLHDVRKEILEDLQGTTKRLAKAIVNVQTQSRRDFDRMLKMMSGFRSEFLKIAEGFATRTVKVETDQTFFGYRLDRLENRVKALESGGR